MAFHLKNLIKSQALRAGMVMLVFLAMIQPVQAELTDPAPDFDNPRKVLLQLNSGDVAVMNGILRNASNIQAFYGKDLVRVAIVVYGRGIRAVYADMSPVRGRVQGLVMQGVEFFACNNTLQAQKRTAEDLIDGVDVVPAGIPEIVERSLRGWVYIAP